MGTRLLGLATVPAPHRAEQKTIAQFLASVAREHAEPAEREAAMRRILALSQRSAIEARHSVLSDYGAADPSAFRFYPPGGWRLDPFPTTRDRMRVFERESVEMAAAACEGALKSAGVAPESITHLLVTTCTGFFAPGPDVLLIDRLGLERDVGRTVLGFMGCYAGFSAMRAADAIARSDPTARVLMVSVELCTLHFQRTLDTETIVANTLFGDGAAAAIWSADPAARGPQLISSLSRVPADTRDEMSWRIGDHGFVMTLDERVPRSLEKEAPGFVRDLLRTSAIDRDRVRAFAVHPGGKRILDSVSRALGGVELDSSRAVLRELGNMSSATIFFVLERELAKGTGVLVALGFGPGLTMEGVILDVA